MAAHRQLPPVPSKPTMCLLTRPLALAAALCLAACSSIAPPHTTAPTGPVKVQVLAINDFHGNLLPPAPFRMPDPANPGQQVQVPVGGSEALATAVKQLRKDKANHIFVAAGDLIGGTPLLSALFFDEPTLESLTTMGLHVSAVGNHEFDRGADELLRRIRGGCAPKEGCRGPQPYKGVGFKYLAASTVDSRTGQTLLPAYHVQQFEGVPVGFIGLTLKGTPGLVMPEAVAGLRFDDEAETINRLVPELQAQGVQAIVVLIHEGGYPSGGHNECPGISGPIVDIVKRMHPAVDVVVTGHTHRAYNCRLEGKLVTSGDKFGSMVTEIELSLDRGSRDVLEAKAVNHLVRLDQYGKDPEQTQLLAAYQDKARPLIERAVGRLSKEVPHGKVDDAGNWPMGYIVADAHFAATRAAEHGGALFALTNTGGVRAGLSFKDGGRINFGDLFTAQPFNNQLVTLTLSGAELLELLEQQWREDGQYYPLQPSQGFSYRWDAQRPRGQRVVPGSVLVQGEPLNPARDYRFTVNSFIATGGDGYQALKKGRDPRLGVQDIDALEAYVRSLPMLQPPAALDRIQRIN